MATQLAVHDCGCEACLAGERPERADHRQLNLLLSVTSRSDSGAEQSTKPRMTPIASQTPANHMSAHFRSSFSDVTELTIMTWRTYTSAGTLTTRGRLTRQKVIYHLHALEEHGLVQLAQERKWSGLTERLLVATAASHVVSPSAMGPIAVDPSWEADRLSARFLIALGARVVREVGDLVRRANEASKRLTTLAVDTEVRFRSLADRAAFSAELTEATAKLVSKYRDESAPGGRAHGLVVVAHPLPLKSDSKEPT